jgi:hypothetical protein
MLDVRVRDRREPHRFCNTTCDLCGAPMYRKPSVMRLNAAKYCTRACRNKVHLEQCYGPNPKKGAPGARNAAWKGGVTYRKRRGNYVSVRYVRCPPQLASMARRDGYVMEHRLVMAVWVGRPLTRTECVHHKDHNPLNNERTNLELWPCNRTHKLAEHGRDVSGAVNQLFLTVLEPLSSLHGNPSLSRVSPSPQQTLPPMS